MVRNLFVVSLGICLLSGCLGKYTRASGYCGTYEGTFPAADGPGIQTTVKIDKQNRFEQKQVYLGEKNGDFTENGSYHKHGSVLSLQADNGEMMFYQIESGQLRRLDMNQEPVSGALAEHYVLKKVADCQ